MKCDINDGTLKLIKNNLARTFRPFTKGSLPDTTLEEDLKAVLEDIKDNYNVSQNIQAVSELIQKTAVKYGISQQFPNFFNLDRLREVLLMSDISTNNLFGTLEEKFTDLPQIRTRVDVSRRFLDIAYGDAIDVMIQALNEVDRFLFDCCFINRGSINAPIGSVQNQIELNKNIRNYQTYLLKQITNYLKSITREATNLKLDESVKQALRNPVLYDADNKYTNILETLKPLIDSYLGNITPQNLKQLMQDISNETPFKRELALLTLNAYNANVFLTHFDTYLALLLGKGINIKDFNQKTGEDKYLISNKTASLITTHRKSEDVDIAKEADAITKLAINTTPIINLDGSDTGRFLQFSDFQHLITKIKNLAFLEQIQSVIFNDEFILNNKDLWDTFSKETLEIIKYKSLSSLINTMPLNAKKYTHIIFEILTNPSFKDTYSSIYNQFSQEELNKLWSLSKGIFNGTNSLKALSSSKSDINFYEYLVQTSNSIYPVEHLQYYRDESGRIYLRKLTDLTIYNIKRRIELSINIKNSTYLQRDWESYEQSHNMSLNNDIFYYTIPDSDILITLYTNSGRIIVRGKDTLTLVPFANKILNLRLDLNPILWNCIKEVAIKEHKDIQLALIAFASRTLYIQYISNKYLKDLSKSEIMELMPDYFGKYKIAFNDTLSLIGLVHPIDAADTLLLLAKGKALEEGISTSIQTKDSEGNGLPLQTFSCLTGSFLTQWELQEKSETSATKNLSLLNIPGLLENVFRIREFHEQGGDTKKIVNMTANEMMYSSFIFDFVKGLQSFSESKDMINDGHIALMLSVNSDKKQIMRLMINLNKKINGLELKNYTLDLLYDLISLEFGNVYTNVYNNITEDWQKLDSFIKSQGIIAPKLSANFIYGFTAFNEFFRNNYSSLNQYGNTPVEFVNYFVREYNKINRLNPLELVDLVHYKSNNGNLDINQTLIAQIARFNPSFISDPNITVKYPTSREYWDFLKKTILKTLLKENFKVNTTNYQTQPELAYLRKNPRWINASGDMILAEVTINGITKKVTQTKDLLNDDLDNATEIKLHPLIERHNLLDYFLTLSYMLTTVGSFIAHPIKSKENLNVIEQEALQFNAQHKRNVSLTALMHSFLLNSLTGIPDTYNISVIEDIKDFLGVISGIINDIKPFDGATFVNPFIVLLENLSLKGSAAGITKKQFVHFKNPRTATGGIIKTAGFGITNDMLRNSPFLQKIMEKMTSGTWIDKMNNPLLDINITENYLGDKVKYKDIYYKENGSYYKVVKIEYKGANTYIKHIQEVDSNGEPTNTDVILSESPIDSNYKLWDFFGGSLSMTLENGKLKYSNTSVENVVIAMNNVSNERVGNADTLDDVYQPLKHSDIHYLCTAGAVKQGAANINSASRYTDNIPLTFQRIKLYLAGIQLDKEHEADDSEISLMTQVISACAAKGYSFEAATALYNSLRRATELGLAEHLEAVRTLFESEDATNIDAVVIESLIKLLATGRKSSNFALAMALDIMDLVKAGKEVNFSLVLLPLSDSQIYNKILSTINSFLTNLGIKLKIPGILAVLTPSHNIMKLYAGRKYESFENPDQELLDLQTKQIPVYDVDNLDSSISDIELGRTYIITEEVTEIDENGDLQIDIISKPEFIGTPIDYYDLKDRIDQGKILKVVEDVRIGRDLAGFNVRFQVTESINGVNERFQLWDLDSAKYLFLLDRIKKNPDIETLLNIYQEMFNEYPDIDDYKKYWENANTRIRKILLNDLENLSPSTENTLKLYQELLNSYENTSNWYSRYAQWVNIKLGRPHGNKLLLGGQFITVNEANFQDVLERVANILKLTTKVKIGGRYKTVDKSTIKTLAYEVIMPKAFATAFNLNEFDDLYTIQNDPDFFIKRYLLNQATKVEDSKFTVELKRTNGNHLYLVTSELARNNKLIELNNIQTTEEDGKLYRVDSYQNIMYELSNDTKICRDTLGNEYIVTDNLEFYINNMDYDSVNLSSVLEESPKIIRLLGLALKKSPNKAAKDYYKYAYSQGVYKVLELNKSYHDVSLDNYQTLNTDNPIIRLGRRKHSSFLKSLEILAARIPAQSMLSYMPMKTVAFDNANINNAYVSTYLILLQGSDYDIDTVSLATYDIDSNGILQLWSPYSRIESLDLLNASMNLPMPTGLKLTIPMEDSIDNAFNFLYKYRGIITINETYNDKGEVDPTTISINFINRTAEDIELLKELLQEVLDITLPSMIYLLKLAAQLQDSGLVSFKFKNPALVLAIFTKLELLVDRHNTYLDILPPQILRRVLNNYSMKSMLATISDPANLLLAHAPIDSVTKPLIDIANQSSEGLVLKTRTPGNSYSKYLSIVENQTGSSGIGICAIGLKGFFGITQYNNYILNHGTPGQLKRLLLGNNHKGHFIGGKSYSTIANIRALNPNTILNEIVLDALSKVSNNNDAALVLSALLSLATDFRTLIKILF